MHGAVILVLFGASLVGLHLLFPQVTTGAGAAVGILRFPIFPVDDPDVSQPFKPGGVHSGIDFRCPIGTPLFCVAPGTVVTVQNDAFSGPSGRHVIMRGRNEFSVIGWSYSHMSDIEVIVGQDLDAGDIVGLSGNTGSSTGPHLHFVVLTMPGFKFTDPTPFLPSRGGE
jgi:murein DD-endopeptidase MepM/ murein hydrolase activator NlpD